MLRTLLRTMSLAAKRSNPGKVIGTHNGTFHCDEVAACFLLKQLPEYADAKVVRSRDPNVLEQCDIVVDVGGVFDPARHRYDHHQRSFNETFKSLRPDKPWDIKLSSAGLVYLHFGARILSCLTQLPETDPLVMMLFDKIYENLILEIDAIDNGISVTDGTIKYRIGSGLSDRVSFLNPQWNQTDVKDDDRFEDAVKLVGGEFLDRLNYYREAWWPARQVVEDALAGRSEVDSSETIMVIKRGGCPWKSHLFELEQQQQLGALENGDGEKKQVLFTLYSDPNGNWRVQAIPPDNNRPFENRLPLPEAWRGLRDDELSAKSGIPGCVFVHATGFIGGNKTYEGALAMAKQTVLMAGR